MTYISTTQGWLYLAVIIDLFVGWSMAEYMRTELVLTALEAALGQKLDWSFILAEVVNMRVVTTEMLCSKLI